MSTENLIVELTILLEYSVLFSFARDSTVFIGSIRTIT